MDLYGSPGACPACGDVVGPLALVAGEVRAPQAGDLAPCGSCGAVLELGGAGGEARALEGEAGLLALLEALAEPAQA